MRHSHSLRRTTLLVVSATLAALVVGIPTAAPADLQDVTLTCSDGTNLNLGLDVASVMQLTDAVNAMALNPAGDPPLTCGVVTASPLQPLADGSRQLAARRPHSSTPRIRAALTLTGTFNKSSDNATRTLSSGNPTQDYVVGGGKAPNLGCFGGYPPVPFGLNAHVRAGDPAGTASGTFNVGSPATNAGCKGHLTSKVDCLVVLGTTAAHLTAYVTQATGQFAGLQDTEIDVAVQDNGTPSAVTPDMIGDGNTAAQCAQGLAAGDPPYPTIADQPVTNGNISVHRAG
jgi:hypothetical protein